MTEHLLKQPEEAWLCPVAMAVFVYMGWIADWPLALTRAGQRAAQVG